MSHTLAAAIGAFAIGVFTGYLNGSTMLAAAAGAAIGILAAHLDSRARARKVE